MTKIDETKQYKFSEIVKMLEDNEMPIGTTIVIGDDAATSITMTVSGKRRINHTDWIFAMVNLEHAITSACTIKLTIPKEDKFYLKAPKEFRDKYLNLNMNSGKYFLSDKSRGDKYQTQFTQSEIDAMSFDTDFFGEPIKVEDE